MKTKAVLVLAILLFSGFICQGNDGVPVAISPGSNQGVGSVENRCPAFSWSGVAWAQKYRVVVFGVEDEGARSSWKTELTPKDEGARDSGEMKLTAKPILSEDIAGGGLSWTPSVSQGLPEGVDYVWYVGAMDASGAWAWSVSRRFRVEASAKVSLSEEVMSSSKQQVSKAEGNVEAATRAVAALPKGKTTGKEGTTNYPKSPMGTEGTYSTFYGTGAGANNSSDGNANSFFGSNAGYNTTIGNENTFMGLYAGYTNTTGQKNTFIGAAAGCSNTTGDNNTFMGTAAGDSNTTGLYNTFIGGATGSQNITGNLNTFMGYAAGINNTTGYFNTFLGNNAGYANITGNSNTFLGLEAGSSNTTGYSNTFLGFQTGYNETGSNKLYIDNSNTTTPLIYGDFATNKVGINGWLGVGTQAPAYPMELKTSGVNAAFVANRSGGAINYINATDAFGNFGTVNSFPLRLVVNAAWRMRLNSDNSLTMANGASCTVGGVWTNASSITLKENIASLSSERATAALQGLNPVTYNYKADKAEKYVGFIAEEVPELVAMNDHKSLSPMDIVAVLTKVVQEQQKLNHEQQKLNQAQQKAISFLKAKLSALEKKVAEEK